MFIRNAWYVGAWSHEVEGDVLFTRKMLGETLLFFRTGAGQVTAIRDRCGHRFAPLSLGRREGDCVRCMYHGLVYDAEGRCIEEPGREGISPNLDVRRYPTVERYKQIWVWMGDPALADPARIPDCHYQDDPGWASIPAYVHYRADYRLILDNLMDFSHLAFVHESTLGGSATLAEVKPRVEQTGSSVRLTRWYLNEPKLAPYLEGLEAFEGPVDRWHIYELFIDGNVFVMDSGSAPAGTGAPEGARAPEAMQFRAVQIVTPEDERSSHFFWTYAHNFQLDNRALTETLAARIAEGFQEDLRMIEAQQKMIDESGQDAMGFILADRALARTRRLIEQRLEDEAAGAEPLALGIEDAPT